jgi:hypothetical protein
MTMKWSSPCVSIGFVSQGYTMVDNRHLTRIQDSKRGSIPLDCHIVVRAWRFSVVRMQTRRSFHLHACIGPSGGGLAFTRWGKTACMSWHLCLVPASNSPVIYKTNTDHKDTYYHDDLRAYLYSSCMAYDNELTVWPFRFGKGGSCLTKEMGQVPL